MVKSCLREGKLDEAAVIAEDLRGSSMWVDVMAAFEASGAGQHCGVCKAALDVFVNPVSLAVYVACFACREKKIKEERDAAVKAVAVRLRAGVQHYMAIRGVPPLFLDAVKEDFPQDWHLIIDSGEGLFVSAPRGVGKTHLAAAIVRQAILNLSPRRLRAEGMRAELFPLFVDSLELLLELRDSFGNDQITERSIIDRYSGAPLLVLDDLGAEKSSEWSIQTLYTIIDRRYRNKLPTIITSNLNLDQVAARLDDRIASRIAGMCEVRSMIGEDRRVK